MKAIFAFIVLIIISSCSGNNKQQLLPEQIRISDSLALVEKEKQAILDSLGIWEIKTELDEFGELTSYKYAATTVYGTFSNSATQDSELRVEFVNSQFRLYEYNGNNPVKGNYKDKYIILVQDKYGERYQFDASLVYKDRISCEYFSKYKNEQIQHQTKLNLILFEGGEVKFVVKKADDYLTVYRFTIPNADGYKFAFVNRLNL